MENTKTNLKKAVAFLRAPFSALIFLYGAGSTVCGVMAIFEDDIKWFLLYLSSGLLLMIIGYRMRPPREAKSDEKEDDW
ncbi:MAG: hypothetical protein V1894_01105 [Chloroflexota bacterium]